MTNKQAQAKINTARELINSGRRDAQNLLNDVRGARRDNARLQARIDSIAIRYELLMRTEK